ncbi:MAG: divergent polysaccharide deacetylase family protein, partial [Pseudomonadota bacterium]
MGKYAFGVFCIAAMIGLNAATNQFLDPKPATEIVTIAEPSVEVEQVTASISEPASPQPVIQNGVEVVYGTPSAPQLNEQPNLSPLTNNAPVPERRPDGSSERSLSPGGPKIITLAPSSPSLGQPIEVAHLPEDAALEDFGEGMVLPRISEDGRRPMDIYARPWSQGSGKRIAIMIGGIGLSQTSSQAAIEKLPPEITLGFSPAGNSLNRWMRAARKKGHELIVQVPMEPFNYPQVNPGPKTLRLASTAETNIERLHASLASITNYTGVSNYLGARFMTSADATNPIFREVGQRGLLFFNDGTAKAPRLAVNAEALGVPYVEA